MPSGAVARSEVFLLPLTWRRETDAMSAPESDRISSVMVQSSSLPALFVPQVLSHDGPAVGAASSTDDGAAKAAGTAACCAAAGTPASTRSAAPNRLC